MKLTVVSTLYNSARYLDEFVRRMSAAASAVTDDFEIILVNDGSPDTSIDIALGFHASDPRIKVVDLSRNFGHHKAVMAGLSFSSGRYIFLIDCDLEESPELLSDFYHKLANQDSVDVYYGVQKKRKGGLVERIGGEFFYRLFNMMSKLKLPKGPLTVRIMTQRYVKALICHTEEELFLAGLFESTGFRQEQITVNKSGRKTTSYSFWKRLRLMVAGITSFSSFPLYISFYVGNVISLAALSYAAYLAIRKIFSPGMIIEGWTSLMISVWFLGGVILISCGMIGLYLSRVYHEVKRRPNFIVRQDYGFHPHSDS